LSSSVVLVARPDQRPYRRHRRAVEDEDDDEDEDEDDDEDEDEDEDEEGRQ
jgi:hypothetical protein